MLLSVTMQGDFRREEGRRQFGTLARRLVLSLLVAVAVLSSQGQTPGDAANPAPSAQPVVITLEEAIHRAEANEPAYAAALAENKASSIDRYIARGALLPGVVYHNLALYTQPNGVATTTATEPAQKFIANNAVHEYASQASVNETFGLAGVAGVRRADAASAFAAAELEVARRGLVAAGTGLFYGSPGGAE